jgi:hypothetical protein
MGVEHLFDAFEQDLDLPSAGVQLQDESHRPLLLWQGCHQEVKAREKEGVLTEFGPFVPRLLLPLLPHRFGLLVGEDHRNQSDRQAFAIREHGGVALMGFWS